MKSLAHEIRGLPVHATDGEIGSVKDIVFEASTWRIHFLEVETGWLFGRDVLIPVEKIVRVEMPEKGVTVDLTKQAIKDSPAAKSARPVESDYHELFPYFGLSSPWAADAMTLPSDPAPDVVPDPKRRLFFARDLEGYQLEAQGEEVGVVRDVLIDLERRKVFSLSADVGGLIEEDVAEISLGRVTDIDAEHKIVRVNLRTEAFDRNHRLSPDDLPYVLPYIPPIL